MKLLRLKLNEKFRSLQAGFELHFLREWDYEKAGEFNPYCLVGRNGSGKSNVLEVLAAIFYHVECMYLSYKPDDFEHSEENPDGFKSDKGTPDAYELEYFFPRSGSWETEDGGTWLTNEGDAWELEGHEFAHISIIKAVGEPPEIHWLNRAEFEKDYSTTKLNRTEVKDFLPKFILGYSSGENEILSLPFFKMRFIHYDEYVDRLTKGFDYGQAPEGRLVYLDNQFSQAILLCNFLMQQDVVAPFNDEVGLEAIEEFRIIIKTHHTEQMQEEFLQGLTEEERVKEENQNVELTKKVKTAIEKLKKCSTASYHDAETDSLYLDYWVNPATREAFEYHFSDTLTLFQTFQILLTLNLYTVSKATKKKLYESPSLFVNEIVPTPPAEDRIMRFADFNIRKKGVDGLIFIKALSDGEHQFLHSLGLCLLFKDEPCLFLLDEPETHFNPGWRAKFISSLRDSLVVKDKEGNIKEVMREMLITSHSPFIVSDSREENVLVFEKDEQKQEVECKRPGFNTFGASINQITMKIFEKAETIGGYAKTKLEALEKRLEDGEDGRKLIDEANAEFGDSVEKILFINRVLDKIEGK